MKSFTGKLMLKFTAKVRSRADLKRRCEKIAAAAEHTIGCELWDFEELVELPTVIPFGYYAVQLCTVGNPDRGQYVSPTEPAWKIVETMAEAKAAVLDYIERHDEIGGGNWGLESGRIWDHRGEIVGYFTYNLRCWSPDGVREIQVK